MQCQNNSIRSMGFSSDPDSCDWELAGVHASQATAVPLLEPVSQQTSHKPRVLVLEDDSLQAQLLEKTIDSLGLTTLFAQCIAEARHHLKNEPIQLGVFDLHLPDGSGIDLCREIDNDPQLAGLPVVIVSSAKQDHIIRQTRAVGCSYFISKPYDPNVLVAIIERLIDLSL